MRLKFSIISVFRMVFVMVLVLQSSVYAKGVAALKEKEFHRDESAKIFIFEDVKSTGNLIRFTIKGAKPFGMPRSRRVEYIETISNWPENILDEGDIAPFRENIINSRAFLKKYPHSSSYLKSYIDALAEIITSYDKPSVKYKGAWISRDNYTKIKDGLKEQASMAQKKLEATQAQRKEFEYQQHQKGLTLYQGKWIPKEKASQLRKQAAKIANVAKVVKNQSIKKVNFSVFQILSGGQMLISVPRRGQSSLICHVVDAENYTVVSDEAYNGDLYYCGIYTYTNANGYLRKAKSYCLSYKSACSVVRARLYPSKDEPRGESVARSSEGGVLDDAKSTGSGFFIGGAGYFITNYHVIKGASKIQIYYQGKTLDATIQTSSKVADLAVLKVEKKIVGLSMISTEREVGDDIFAIGFPQPGLQGLSVKVTKGVISSMRGLDQDDTIYQIDAAVQPGNSGGPICDDKGKVVGVVVAKLNELQAIKSTGSIPQNVNYAIKSPEVWALLRSKKIDIKVNKNTNQSDSVKDGVKGVGLVIIK
jgi:S1-C subfamily serine protease